MQAHTRSNIFKTPVKLANMQIADSFKDKPVIALHMQISGGYPEDEIVQFNLLDSIRIRSLWSSYTCIGHSLVLGHPVS